MWNVFYLVLYLTIFSDICKLLVLFTGEHQFMIRTFSHQCLAKLMFKRRETLASLLYSKYETFFLLYFSFRLQLCFYIFKDYKNNCQKEKTKKTVKSIVFANFQLSSHFNYLLFQSTFKNLKYFPSINVINSIKLVLYFEIYMISTFKISFQ